MDSELNKRLLESFDKAQEYVKAGGEFVAEQAPLVVQEVIKWGLSSHIFWAVMMVGFIGFLAWLGKKLREVAKKEECSECCLTTTIVQYVLSIGFALAALHHLYMVVYILVAPRLYILETLSGLINRNGGR